LPRNRAGPIPRPRIETLSDLVFGLALSIGALTLISKTPSKPGDILTAVLGFGFSFIILISVWLRYTWIMSALPLETATAIALNIALLFLVSVEPYLLSLVNTAGAISMFDYASIAYAIDLAGLVAILGFFTHMLTIEEKKLVPARMVGRQRMNRNALFFMAFLFLISTLPQFLAWGFDGTPLRVIFWYVSLIILWSLRVPRVWNR
jgi:transmembrane protein TMEM174 (potassium channel)